MSPIGSATSWIKASDTARFFPDLHALAIKKLFGFPHGCFVVLTFNELRGLPEVPTFIEGVDAIGWHQQPHNAKGYNGRLFWVPVVS
jgi:hypothetical protein